MTANASLVSSIEAAAKSAGLKLISTTETSDPGGQPTQIFQLGLPGLDDRRLHLELTEAFDFDQPHLLPEMAAHLAAEAKRLRERVAAEIKTTFASHYTKVVSLREALHLEAIAAYGKRATGEKYLINPNMGLDH